MTVAAPPGATLPPPTAVRTRGTCQSGHRPQRNPPAPRPPDHARLKARLRPKRGLKQFRSAARITAGHAFVQNLRRGHYDLATDTAPPLRLATAFTELALAM